MTDLLNSARLQLFERLYDQINTASKRAIEFYQTEADRVKLSWNNRKWFHGDIVGVSNGVDIKWDVYRRNCHVDGGQFSIPWDAIADDTYKDYITTLVGQQLAKQDRESAAAAAAERKYKKAQLAQLKAELGEE